MRNYYPNNGTDGMIFTAQYCDRCYKQGRCTILANAFFGKEPKQWVYDDDGNPTCTSFCHTRPKPTNRKAEGKTLFD